MPWSASKLIVLGEAGVENESSGRLVSDYGAHFQIR